MKKLKYIGAGAFIVGIPARDLTEEEAKRFGGADYLVELGLYEVVSKPAPKENKLGRKPKEDKNED